TLRDRIGIMHRSVLLGILDNISNREPTVCELVDKNGVSLFLGIGKPYGGAEFRSASQRAVQIGTPIERNSPDIVGTSFQSASGAISLPSRYLLPFELVKQIAVEFFETGDRSPLVLWVAIPDGILSKS